MMEEEVVQRRSELPPQVGNCQRLEWLRRKVRVCKSVLLEDVVDLKIVCQ